MNQLPKIVSLHTSERHGVFGSFINPEWVWHYSAAGTWKFQLEGRSYEIHAGEIVLVPPRLLHVVHPLSEGRLLLQVVHFDLPEFSLNKNLPYVVKVIPKFRRELTSLFRAIHEEWIAERPHRETIIGGYLAVMIGIYLRNISSHETEKAVESSAWKNITQAIQFVHINYGKQALTLGDIAAASGLSRNYLCRVFKQNIGCSPMHYLNQHRVQNAAEKLITSPLNCSQIAEAVGYSNIHLFSRVFKEVRGISPTAFQKLHAPRIGN